MDTVAIDLAPVALADLLRVARGAPVALTDAALERIAAGGGSSTACWPVVAPSTA